MLYLTFYHHSILVRCNESSLLKKLQEEFHFFQVEDIPEDMRATDFIIDAYLKPPPEIPSMEAKKILEHVTVYQRGDFKYLDYSGNDLAIWNHKKNHVELFSVDASRLFEISFLCIHSLLGQSLDRSGLCRLHALGVSMNSLNAIVMLPSMGGKSTLLKELIQYPEIKIISDDTPLCDTRGRIHPFPSKISLEKIPEEGPLATLTWNEFKRQHFSTKWTLSLSQIKDRISIHSADHKNILIQGLRISSGVSHIKNVPKWKMIKPMMEHMIIGFGLPQILEMFLNFKFGDAFKLFVHGFIRSLCAFHLVRKSRCYYMYLGPDKSLNATLIRNILHEHQN